MLPTPPPLLNPDPSVDALGFIFMWVIPLLLGVLTFSRRAQQVAQVLLNVYKVYRGFMEQMHKTTSKPAAAPTNGNGNGNGHSNGNGNGGASDLLKSVMQNLRVEADARESGDQSIAQRIDSLSERGRRDSDKFYMLYSELSRDSKRHEEDIKLLKLEQAKTQTQMVDMFKEQGGILEMILHYVQPPPPTPPRDVIRLDDSDDLEAVG